jgi:type III secretion protein J
MRRMRTGGWLIVVVGLVVLGLGCTIPVAGALDEAQANRVVVALEHAGVGAEKEADPATEGRYRVVVERDEAPRAIAALREEDLPASSSPGLLDAVGKGALVPSQIAEQAQLTAGLGGELERTLGAIDGVLSARVHLSLPAADPLADGPRPKATASVLLKHRGATPPIDADAVKRLVAGAAPGLTPDAVTVVLLPRPLPAASGDRGLAKIGPIWATRGSVSLLRLVIATSIAIDLALVAAVLLLWSRLRRAGAADEEAAKSA